MRGLRCLSMLLVLCAGQEVRAQAFIGGSAQGVLVAPRGRGRVSLRLDLGYRVHPWVEVGTAVGLTLAKRGPASGPRSSRRLFDLDQQEVGVVRTAAAGLSSDPRDSDLGAPGSAFGQAGSSGNAATSGPQTGAQALATCRMLLPQWSPTLGPFVEAEGGVQWIDGLLAAKGSASFGLQLSKRNVAAYLVAGYSVSRWQTSKVDHMVLVGLGVRAYLFGATTAPAR